MKKYMAALALFLAVILLAVPVSADGGEESAENETETAAPVTETAPVTEADGGEDELRRALEINEKLYGLYSTWTAVIGIVLVLVTLFGIGIPLYNQHSIDKKIKAASSELWRQSAEIDRRRTAIMNAAMLSASKEYGISNDILRRLLKDEAGEDDTYLHLMIGRNVFYEYYVERLGGGDLALTDAGRREAENAIEHYLIAAGRADGAASYYELGAVFPDSIAHELSILTSMLIESSINTAGCGNYHALTVRVLRATEKILGVSSFDDIANMDQTNVFLMNYIVLQRDLARSYMHFGNVKAREQYEYVLKLYTISNEIDYESEIADCRQRIAELGDK